MSDSLMLVNPLPKVLLLSVFVAKSAKQSVIILLNCLGTMQELSSTLF